MLCRLTCRVEFVYGCCTHPFGERWGMDVWPMLPHYPHKLYEAARDSDPGLMRYPYHDDSSATARDLHCLPSLQRGNLSFSLLLLLLLSWRSSRNGQERDYKFMKKAVDEAYSAIDCGDGRPFGAVIIRDDDPLAICHNMVLRNSDPSAHAEVTAIRAACKRLGKIDLSDCEIYSSCQPCPMCMAAIHFSKIKNVVYGAKVEVAVAAGFSGFIPEAFVEYYRKSGMEIRQVEGDAARIAEEVFEKVKSSG
ncbi:hypothetical protein ACP4OV_006970 [Aristida adscensionis]